MQLATPTRFLVTLLLLLDLVAAKRHSIQRYTQELTPESECVAGDVDLTFAQATVYHNNLGNIGPDTGDETIVFGNVGTFEGESINMVVSIAPGAEYIPADLDRNGMICTSARRSCEVGGDFGQVNLQVNQPATTLHFQFQSNSTGEPVVLPGFLFSGLDIDGQLMEETYVIKGWDTAYYDRNSTEAYFSEDEPGFCDGSSNCLYAHSTNQGSVCDNPLDAFDLGLITCAGRTVHQRLRSFLLSFSDTSEFEVFFNATRPARDYGRNFVFAFASSWADSCMLLPTAPPTTAPVAPTTALPTSTPTVTPTDIPTAGPTDSPTANPSNSPTTLAPTLMPSTLAPTIAPTVGATIAATTVNTTAPTMAPTNAPTKAPTNAPVTSSPVAERVVEAPPTCPGKAGKGGKGGDTSGKGGKGGDISGKGGIGKGSVPDEAYTESRSSKMGAMATTGKGGKGNLRHLQEDDECVEESGKAGKGGSGKGGKGEDMGSGKGGKGGEETATSGKGGKGGETTTSGKGGKGGDETVVSGKGGKGANETVVSGKGASTGKAGKGESSVMSGKGGKASDTP